VLVVVETARGPSALAAAGAGFESTRISPDARRGANSGAAIPGAGANSGFGSGSDTPGSDAVTVRHGSGTGFSACGAGTPQAAARGRPSAGYTGGGPASSSRTSCAGGGGGSASFSEPFDVWVALLPQLLSRAYLETLVDQYLACLPEEDTEGGELTILRRLSSGDTSRGNLTGGESIEGYAAVAREAVCAVEAASAAASNAAADAATSDAAHAAKAFAATAAREWRMPHAALPGRRSPGTRTPRPPSDILLDTPLDTILDTSSPREDSAPLRQRPQLQIMTPSEVALEVRTEQQASLGHSQQEHSQQDHSQRGRSQQNHSQQNHSQQGHSQQVQSQPGGISERRASLGHSQRDHPRPGGTIERPASIGHSQMGLSHPNGTERRATFGHSQREGMPDRRSSLGNSHSIHSHIGVAAERRSSLGNSQPGHSHRSSLGQSPLGGGSSSDVHSGGRHFTSGSSPDNHSGGRLFTPAPDAAQNTAGGATFQPPASDTGGACGWARVGRASPSSSRQPQAPDTGNIGGGSGAWWGGAAPHGAPRTPASPAAGRRSHDGTCGGDHWHRSAPSNPRPRPLTCSELQSSLSFARGSHKQRHRGFRHLGVSEISLLADADARARLPLLKSILPLELPESSVTLAMAPEERAEATQALLTRLLHERLQVRIPLVTPT
jgi:hypothetical protein